MRAIVFVLAAGVASGLLGNIGPQERAQTIIENPGRPLSANPGRILPLKETLRIVDEGKGFYFKLPWGLAVAPDGTIFVQDDVRLYKFTPDGRFVGNVAKQGQGPGEIPGGISRYLADGDALYIFCGLTKIMKCDLSGKLIREWKLSGPILHFLGVRDGRMFMAERQTVTTTPKEGLRTDEHRIVVLAEDGSKQPGRDVFTTQSMISIRTIGGRTGVAASTIARLEAGKRAGRYVYLSHTQEYAIKQLDLESGSIVRIFRREYPRIRYKKDPRDTRPMPEYEVDVHRLLVHGDHIWALTSTFDPKKGVLTDVFDEQGRFIDSFILPVPAVRTGDEYSARYFPVAIQGDFLYAIEHDADWNFSIARYEIPKDAGR